MTDATLNLRVLTPGSAGTSHDIVARVEPIRRGQLSSSGGRSLVIPLGSAAGFDVAVDAGAYAVQLFLPNGRVLQQFCEVGAGDTFPLTFHEPGPAEAGFSLQESVGNASLQELLQGAVDSRNRGEVSSLKHGPVPSSGRRSSSLRPRASLRIGSGGFPQPVGRRSRRSLETVQDPAPAEPGARLCLTQVGAFEGEGAWGRLADGPGTWSANPDRWSGPDPALSRDGAFIWRLDGALAGEHPGQGRVWALVRAGEAVEMLSIPAPWRCAQTYILSPVDVLTDITIGGRAGTTAAVHDVALDGLLSYLDRGRLASVRPIVEEMDKAGLIERTIYLKGDNPLAACAAAYVGLALFEPWEQERWDAWLPNLVTRFPWLPDAGILHARRIFLRPKSNDESADALSALKMAYRAGVPYYSTGLVLMREMLSTLAVEHEEAADMLETVSRVTARADPKRMFTVLRYPA